MRDIEAVEGAIDPLERGTSASGRAAKALLNLVNLWQVIALMSSRCQNAVSQQLALRLDDPSGRSRRISCAWVTRQKRVVFFHAKVNSSQMSVSTTQIVGRQAMASLAFLARGARLLDRTAWWQSPWSTDDHLQVPHRLPRSATPDFATTWNE